LHSDKILYFNVTYNKVIVVTAFPFLHCPLGRERSPQLFTTGQC